MWMTLILLGPGGHFGQSLHPSFFFFFFLHPSLFFMILAFLKGPSQKRCREFPDMGLSDDFS